MGLLAFLIFGGGCGDPIASSGADGDPPSFFFRGSTPPSTSTGQRKRAIDLSKGKMGRAITSTKWERSRCVRKVAVYGARFPNCCLFSAAHPAIGGANTDDICIVPAASPFPDFAQPPEKGRVSLA